MRARIIRFVVLILLFGAHVEWVYGQGFPHFRVNPADEHVWGHQWPTGSVVSVMRGDPSVVLGTALVDDQGDWHLEVGELGYDLVFGDLLTVSDGVTEIAHTIRYLTITEVNVETDTISGTADPETWLHVGIHDEDVDNAWVQADTQGVWSATFAFDIRAGVRGGANQEDDQTAPYGSTYVTWEVLRPYFRVNPEVQDSPWAHGGNSLWGHDWPVGAVVTAYMDGAELGTALVDEHRDWELHDPAGMILAGDTLVVTDGETLITYTVNTNLVITDIDAITDTVQGYAAPHSWVGVEVWHPEDDYLWIQADEEGHWSAALNIDLEDGAMGGVYQNDDDGLPFGSTYLSWLLPKPVFHVNRLAGEVWGNQWPQHAEVTLVIGDPVDPDYTEVTTTDGSGNWWVRAIPIALEVGTALQVTCADKVKTHEVEALGIPEVDGDLDTVRGMALPDVWVELHLYGFGVVRRVQADENGDWLADLATAGVDEDTYDLIEGSEGDVAVRDEDGDGTVIPWRCSTIAPSLFIGWFEAKEGDQPAVNIFEVQVEGSGIQAARFRAPDDAWYMLSPNWWRDEWSYEVETNSFAALEGLFTRGDYHVEITRAEGVTTSLLHVASSFEMPDAAPTLLYPSHEATDVAWPSMLMQWNSTGTSSFDAIYIEVYDEDADEDVMEVLLEDTTRVVYPVGGLTEHTSYEVSLGFLNYSEGVTADGVDYEIVKARFVEVAVSTGSSADPFLLDRVAWYGAHGIERGDAESWADVDRRDAFGKGMTLQEEFVADTDPALSNSLFIVRRVHPGPPLSVEFEPASTGRVYTLLYCDDLLAGSWQTEQESVAQPGGGGVDFLSMTNAHHDRLHFRVKVELP